MDGEERDPFAAITDELHRMVFDGFLREEIDAASNDPELSLREDQ
jgi:hypothetical protein